MVWLPVVVILPFAAYLVFGAARKFWRGNLSVGEFLQLIAQAPATPSLPGVKYLFPGRYDAPDPAAQSTAVSMVDRREPAKPPEGLRMTREGDTQDEGLDSE